MAGLPIAEPKAKGVSLGVSIKGGNQMRKVVLSMMVTLDGYGAGPHDEMDWLPPFNNEALWKDLHADMWKALNKVDTILLGRVTYQIWEKYWPAAGANPASTKNDRDFAKFADETEKIVFSRTLDKVEWENTRLVTCNIAEEIAKLKEQPGKDIALAGGPGIARTFMSRGLVDDYKFLVSPVALGDGKPLFKGIESRLKLKLIDTKVYKSGIVGLHYEPVRA